MAQCNSAFIHILNKINSIPIHSNMCRLEEHSAEKFKARSLSIFPSPTVPSQFSSSCSFCRYSRINSQCHVSEDKQKCIAIRVLPSRAPINCDGQIESMPKEAQKSLSNKLLSAALLPNASFQYQKCFTTTLLIPIQFSHCFELNTSIYSRR